VGSNISNCWSWRGGGHSRHRSTKPTSGLGGGKLDFWEDSGQNSAGWRRVGILSGFRRVSLVRKFWQVFWCVLAKDSVGGLDWDWDD
jgi:hypothetical protein